MYRLPTDHSYRFELTMHDYENRVPLPGGVRSGKRNIIEYHSSFRDAFNSLLLMDIRTFEPAFNDHRVAYRSAKICSTESPSPIAEIQIISFQEALEGAGEPGIYLYTSGLICELESLTGLDFSLLDSYIADNTFLLLARYSFDHDLNIHVDPAYDRIWDKHLRKEAQRVFSETEWKYQVKTDVHHDNLLAEVSTVSYHYQRLGDAFRDMMKFDMTLLDPNLSLSDKDKGLAKNVILAEREGDTLVEMIAVKDESSQHRVSEPGIHLYFPNGVTRFEQMGGINLSMLGNYEQDEYYLLLANYDRTYSQVLHNRAGYISRHYAPGSRKMPPPSDDPSLKL